MKFDVKNDKSHHTTSQLEVGNALVYVIQNFGTVHCIGACFITKIALDGSWKGANQRNSNFSFAVGPGEHHLCAKLQSDSAVGAGLVALAHFTAEAGKIYYFRTRLLEQNFDIDPIDSDMGRFYVATLPLSVSQPKK